MKQNSVAQGKIKKMPKLFKIIWSVLCFFFFFFKATSRANLIKALVVVREVFEYCVCAHVFMFMYVHKCTAVAGVFTAVM